MSTMVSPTTGRTWHAVSLSLSSLLLCLGAILTGLVGYWHAIPADVTPVAKTLLPLLWLSLAWLAGRGGALKAYRPVLLAFFGVSLGIWLAWLVGSWPMGWLGLNSRSLPGIVVGKLSEATPIVAGILLVNRLDGRDLAALSLRRGQLGLSLLLGIAVGGLCFLLFLAMGGWQALAYAGAARLLAALPLLAVFVLANGFMEELWFRGSFLNRFESLVGPRLALLLTTVAFAALHASADYTSGTQLIQYVAVTLVTGLAWGLLAQRTRTLWGSVLSHAIGDVFVMIGFFVSLL